jgi:hypothetical protein
MAPLPVNATTDGFDSSDALDSLACPEVGSCVAVGTYFDTNDNAAGLIETLSGGIWTSTEAPEPASTATYQSVFLNSLACPVVGSCEAVGSFQTANAAGENRIELPAVGVIETLSGGTWTEDVAPVPSNASTQPQGNISALDAIACPAMGSCEAVGGYDQSSGSLSAFIETLSNGTWKPTSVSGVTSGLRAVACPEVSSCVAVGQSEGDEGSEVLIETLSGADWTSTSSPLPANAAPANLLGSQEAVLDSVSCPASGSCGALGFYSVPSATGPPYPITDNQQEGLIETIGVSAPPTISSASQATFTMGKTGTFTVTATGVPLPAIAEKGKLPKGLHFTKGKGEATIAGIPVAQKPGSHLLTITATNRANAKATQPFTLTVGQ